MSEVPTNNSTNNDPAQFISPVIANPLTIGMELHWIGSFMHTRHGPMYKVFKARDIASYIINSPEDNEEFLVNAWVITEEQYKSWEPDNSEGQS